MKKFFKSAALVLAAAVVMAFASCSNGSSDDANEFDGYKVIIEDKSISFEVDTLLPIISAEEFSAKGTIKELVIVSKDYVANNDNEWWITIASNNSWANEISLRDGTWSNFNNGWTYTLNGSKLASYLANGMFVQGPAGHSSKFTVYYLEGEVASDPSSSKPSNNPTVLYSANVNGNTVIELLSADALTNYTNGTITISGTWVSGGSTPGICLDGTWNCNLYNATTETNSQTFNISDLKGKSVGINMYSDDTEYTITVTYTE